MPGVNRRRRQIGGLTLPRVGPFASQAATKVSTLSDITITNPGTEIGMQFSSPAKYNHFTITTGWVRNTVSSGGDYAVFLWVNKFDASAAVGSYIDIRGEIGSSGNVFASAGNGGNGAGAGGGGAGEAADTGALGGSGSGWNGFFYAAAQNGNGDSPGFAGATAVNYLSDSGFYPFPAGGDGGSGGGGSNNGAGTFGVGGGGGGGSDGNSLIAASAGGGGGAGGLICIVCNEFIYPNLSALAARGGDGGNGDGDGGGGGGGGGGSIYIATKKKLSTGDPTNLQGGSGGSGASTGSSGNSGNFVLYEIQRNLSLVAHTNWNDTWNNL